MARSRGGSSRFNRSQLSFESLEGRSLLAGDPLLFTSAHDGVASAASVSGDYNQNGIVDAADYGLWRDTLGQVGHELAADGNADHVVDAADYDLWKADFGKSVDHSHDGTFLHSGDYLPTIARNPTHVFESTWDATDGQSRVLIPQGATVTLSDVVDADELRIEGTLIFDPDSDVQLSVTTIVVGATGKLIVRPTSTATHEIVFRDSPIDTSTDPEQITHGLIVLGVADIEGQAKPGYITLSQDIKAGDSTVELSAAPSCWHVGDTIILPDTSDWGSQNGYNRRETRTIAEINGSTLTLDRPTDFAHTGILDYQGAVAALPPIANLSRSVRIRSENPDGVRGHIFFGDNADVSLKYAELDALGRTRAADFLDSSVYRDGLLLKEGSNQIGRYAIHLHHTTAPATIVGNVVNGSPKWGIAIHNSSDNLIAQNVVVDAVGAGIVTEDGNETNNRIIGNYIIGSLGAGTSILSRGGNTPKTIGDGTAGDPFRTSSDLGHEGVGIWMHGQSNYVVGNIILNAGQFGVTVWTRVVTDLEFPDGTTANPGDFIFPEFSGNTVWYSRNGMLFDGVSPLDRVLISNTSIYGVDGGGISSSYSGKFEFDGLTVIGRNHNYVYGFQHNYLQSVIGRNWNIQNMYVGAEFSTNFDISDSFFANNRVNVVNDNSNGADLGIASALRNVKHAKAEVSIANIWAPTDAFVSHIEPRNFVVFDHNGVAGDDFQLLMREQAADFLLPTTGMGDNSILGAQTIKTADGKVNSSAKSRLSPAALTNGELFSRYGVALAGRVAPDDATTRENLVGLLVPVQADNHGPTISDIRVDYQSPTSVIVRWTTDEPSTTALEFDHDKLTDYHYGLFAAADNSLTTEHAVRLDNLLPDTLYAFRPYGQDAAGNTNLVLGSPGGSANELQRSVPIFHTGQQLITQHLMASDITTSTAKVSWVTTLPVGCFVEYRIDNQPPLRTSVVAGVNSHEIELTNLQPETSYSVRVVFPGVDGDEVFSGFAYFTTQ